MFKIRKCLHVPTHIKPIFVATLQGCYFEAAGVLSLIKLAG